MIKYNRVNALSAFEGSNYRELERAIHYVDTEKMSAIELVELISFKALVEQKLHKTYWSKGVVELALKAANKADISERRYIEARLLINEAQIIIRNKEDDKRFKRAKYLLDLAEHYLAELEGCALELLFVKDEKLRMEFELLKDGGCTEQIEQIVQEYIFLDKRFDKFNSETAKTWQLNAKFHCLRVMAYAGNSARSKSFAKKIANQFSARNNKAKALAAKIYTFGQIGFYINEILAQVRGE